ncbi:hypothetical protein EST38_g2639 [Candolleomyces aberdarensis]|uniref:Phosphatidylglycerol lysyltransferase C-terminal domain-containing protein n=1 Tax=Candolleomyces aberdarensis TaxID=2316362 RepID=A0A4Q2DU10_9AGAR|nr:hypothetical protein EST38_g2639 [Candolleomyces aberdarensis]
MPSSTNDSFDKSTIADLVANYGSSSTTAWLEFERYKIWRPSVEIPESEFPPVQGYMTRDDWIFAWGNPLVSSPAALGPTARAFIQFAEEQGLHPVWACADSELEQVLGGEDFGWSTVSCIYEDYVDPAHVIELTSPEAKGQEGVHVVKDLKKNLMRAQKYDVHVDEVKTGEWKDEDRKSVEDGIAAWKAGRSGVQIASTTLQPWLDEKHRRYWIARKDDKIVGILILTPVKSNTWQIKNAVSFPDAPKGTSEALIFTALEDLHGEENTGGASSQLATRVTNGGQIPSLPTSPGSSTAEVSSLKVEPPSSNSTSRAISPISNSGLSGVPTPKRSSPPRGPGDSQSALEDENRVVLTFGISAAPGIEPKHNLGGWKVKALSKTYSKFASSAKLINRGEFRKKFDSAHEPMYVCYPPDGFGLDGVNNLFKLLKK